MCACAERVDWMFEAVIQIFHLHGDVVPGDGSGSAGARREPEKPKLGDRAPLAKQRRPGASCRIDRGVRDRDEEEGG